MAVVVPQTGERWLLDATPDFREQMYQLNKAFPTEDPNYLSGIFLTHAHIGHYTGLMHLGREVMGAKKVATYTMPRMADFLTNHAPWSQLVSLKNIDLQALEDGVGVELGESLNITPFLVPHRDEFSETVGYRIKGPQKTVLYIPDIDKWSKWETDIVALVKEVDVAFLDGTFFQNGEIPGRDMSQIPHPFIEESMALFDKLTPADRSKVHFIHFNHTNPVLIDGREAQQKVLEGGYKLAREGQIIGL